MEPITDTQLQHHLKFIGYGSINADYWFLGMEEGGGDENNIRIKVKFKPIEDCAEAHQALGITKYHIGNKVIQRTWWGMCKVMLMLQNKDADRESIRDYQVEKLGRSKENTLLCELMPLPKLKLKIWEYSTLIPQYASRKAYYEKVKPERIKVLRSLYEKNPPKVIIAYGKKFWSDYRQIFRNTAFNERGQFLVGKDKKTKIIFCDHFTARTMNKKFDEVVSLITEAN